MEAGQGGRGQGRDHERITPPEIKGRREKERDLFFDGKWSNTGRMTEYTRLTKAMKPVWSSAVKIDVSAELRAAFASRAPIIDLPMRPEAPVEVPTLTPDANPKADAIRQQIKIIRAGLDALEAAL